MSRTLPYRPISVRIATHHTHVTNHFQRTSPNRFGRAIRRNSVPVRQGYEHSEASQGIIYIYINVASYVISYVASYNQYSLPSLVAEDVQHILYDVIKLFEAKPWPTVDFLFLWCIFWAHPVRKTVLLFWQLASISISVNISHCPWVTSSRPLAS